MTVLRALFDVTTVEPNRGNPSGAPCDHRHKAVLSLRAIAVRDYWLAPDFAAVGRARNINIVCVAIRAALHQPMRNERSVWQSDQRRKIRPVNKQILSLDDRAGLRPFAAIANCESQG